MHWGANQQIRILWWKLNCRYVLNCSLNFTISHLVQWLHFQRWASSADSIVSDTISAVYCNAAYLFVWVRSTCSPELVIQRKAPEPIRRRVRSYQVTQSHDTHFAPCNHILLTSRFLSVSQFITSLLCLLVHSYFPLGPLWCSLNRPGVDAMVDHGWINIRPSTCLSCGLKTERITPHNQPIKCLDLCGKQITLPRHLRLVRWPNTRWIVVHMYKKYQILFVD